MFVLTELRVESYTMLIEPSFTLLRPHAPNLADETTFSSSAAFSIYFVNTNFFPRKWFQIGAAEGSPVLQGYFYETQVQ